MNYGTDPDPGGQLITDTPDLFTLENNRKEGPNGLFIKKNLKS